MPSAGVRMPARGRVVTRVGGARVIDNPIEPVRVARRPATGVSRQIQVTQREIYARVQLPESLTRTESLQIYLKLK